ncbi:AAA family ATPase [Devosia marina]|uniref:AAA family ATPase n=1 Tax=Devosia marina TaxID=2683198 RepID=A0A7X3K2I1_9HYPH|nr:AAA family ATPase [Devosia marina]MVS97895.1 AAA family ATPase [Devosia marina]
MNVPELFTEAKVSGASAAAAEVQYTIATSDRPIAKRFAAIAGKPTKRSSDAPLSSGHATTSFLIGNAAEMASQLAATLETLDVNQVLICAPPPEGQVTWRLVVDDKVDEVEGSISRTKRFFQAPEGPGLCPLDFDTKEFPSSIKARLDSLRTPLEAIFPAFAEAADVSRPSMSTGIRHKGTGTETPKQGGLHRYFIAKDGQDVPRFARVVRDRLVLNGWGWPHVTAAGRVLIKTIIDFNATTDQSRVWYEGKAILESDELEFVPDARKAVVRAGGFLDTSLLPDLSDAERAELNRIEFELRAEKADEAERVRLDHKQRMRGRVPNIQPSGFADFNEDHNQAVEKDILQGDFPILLDDGRLVTAREISQAPGRYAGQTCPDPLEPEYGAGRNVAIILNGGGDTRIESQAHGGQTFHIRMKVSDFFEEIEEEPATQSAERVIVPTPFVWEDPATIPPREWLYGGHYLRKFISATVAPGSLGKSSLVLVENMAMATQRALLGVMPHGRYNCWYWNGEDPFDEIKRRVHAVMLYYGIERSEIEGRFFYDSGRSTPLTIARQTKDGVTIHEPDFKAIKAAIRARSISVLSIDPFVSSHRVTENDNDAMAMVARSWAQIADELNISIELVHHARKLGGREVTAEDARGGGALVDAARDVRTLTRPASDKELRSISPDGDRRSFFRFGDGKSNLTAPAGKDTKWMTLKSQHLGNATPNYPAGDSIGVVAEHKPLAVVSYTSDDDTAAILDELRSGDYRDDPRSPDWSGNAVAKVLGLEPKDEDDKAVIVARLRELKAARLITTVRRPDAKRVHRTFVKVCEQ